MTDFFISYTQADRAWAEWIAGVLEAASYEVRLQAWDFRPGKNFVAELHRIVDEAERTVVVLSPDYLTSQFGLAEWTAAFRQDPTGAFGKLLPVKVREVDPGGLLRSLTYIDLVGLEATAARERLMAGLSRGRAKPGVLPEFPGGASPVPDAATAVSWLSSLPTEEVPAPRHLPAGSRMPFSPNPLFVGRQDDLRTLARHLKHGETLAVGQVEIAATTGLGGIGKTQLACEFVYRYGAYFAGGVFWMSFAEPTGVPAEVAACGRGLNLHPTYESLPLDEQISLVEQAWQRPLPRLLVFDNCEDEELLDRWRPPFGGSAVLVTSRRARWEPTLGVRTIPLGTLPRFASLELLHKFRPDVPLDDSALGAIADELGDLPLALHLAGSFLAHYANSALGDPVAYLKSLRHLSHPALQGLASKISPTRREVHLGRMFALSVERLKPEDPTDELALALLARAACFAPGESIPRRLLLKTVNLDKEGAEAPLRAEDALGRLEALGLLEQGEAGGLLMHRLVAGLVGNFESGEAARAAVEKTFLAEANRLKEAGYPAPLEVWRTHLRTVAKEARRRAARLDSALDDLGAEHSEIEAPAPRAPKVFLSYSHDSPEHEDRVLALCDRLRANGVDAWVDQYETSPAEGWPRWCANRVQEANFVLVICTEIYERRFRGAEEPGRGLGGNWEGYVVIQELYDAGVRNAKFIPILFPESVQEHIPVVLRGATRYNPNRDEEYWRLVRHLTGQPERIAPPLGKTVSLPPLERRTVRFTTPPQAKIETYLSKRSEDDLSAAHLLLKERTIAGQGAEDVRDRIIQIRRAEREGVRLQQDDFLCEGRFHLLEKLGRGGFATVWKAWDEVKHGLVAVKVLHGQHVEDRSRRERFFRGARRMAELHHSGIVRVVEEYLESDGHYFFVMEYVGGGDLRKAVLDGRLSQDMVLPLIVGIGQALAFAHEKGMIHRDVKPANVLLDGNHPKLADFDLVRVFDSTGGTQTQDHLGTFLYSAPEVLANAKEAGFAADIYSLAMTAIFTFYARDLPLDVWRRPDVFVKKLPCSTALQEGLLRGIALEPEERPGSISEFCQSLV